MHTALRLAAALILLTSLSGCLVSVGGQVPLGGNVHIGTQVVLDPATGDTGQSGSIGIHL